MAHACEKLRLRPVGGFGLRRHPQLLPRRDVSEAQHDLDQRHPQRLCNLQLSVGERFGAQADLLPPGLETCARRKARDVGCDVRGLARIAAPDDRAHFFLTEEHNVIARLARNRNGQQSRRIGRVGLGFGTDVENAIGCENATLGNLVQTPKNGLQPCVRRRPAPAGGHAVNLRGRPVAWDQRAHRL